MDSGDLALVNGRLITMESGQPEAAAALVRKGRIVAVGSSREIRDAAGDAPEYDCAGRTVVPGFIDGHAHFEYTCLALARCLSCPAQTHTSLAQIAADIAARAERTPPGEWIIARTSFGLQHKVAEGRLFTRQELDALDQAHPIVVLSGMHVAMLNTPGLRALNLWQPGAPLPPGITVHREPDGTPTGVATEIWSLLPAFPKEVVKDAIREQGTRLFLANGVTTIHNLPYSAADIQAVQELQAADELPIRLRVFYHVPHQIDLDSVLAMGLKSGFGDDMLRHGGIKIFVDGIGHDGFDNPLWDVKWTRDELFDLVSRAHAAGQQLWMHVLRIESLRLACDAVEAALRASPAPHRHRLEHSADIVREPADIGRMRALGLRVVTTPQFLYSSLRGTRRQVGGPPLRALIDAGFEVIGSSDSTGTVPDGNAPLFNIGCVQTMLPEEGVSVDECLRMFTTWAAAGAFEEDAKGSIAVGKLGDFAILPADPREVAPEALLSMPVDATIIGGAVVWERGSDAAATEP